MQFLTLALVSLIACASTPPPATPPAAPTIKDELPPPSMVLQEGGRTKIGTDKKVLKALFEDHIEAREKAGGFLSEFPQHSVKVDDCYLMVTEVTNEQFKKYVEAANARPPFLWAKDAIKVALDEFLVVQAEKRAKAKEEGKRLGPRKKFDGEYWWDQNWEGQSWAMPDDIAVMPVVYINYQDASGYAKWAGLRLPTEFEWERAVRGNGSDKFPWGDDWKAKMAATKEMRNNSEISPVGSFPDGANENGVMDLIGNVWEWTSSKYVEYPGWKHKKFTIGTGRNNKKVINTIPKWSADRRVARGGCQSVGWIFANATIRGGFDRYQRTSAFGFRCAASTRVGLDFATQSMANIPNEIRPSTTRGPVTYVPNQVIAMDRWLSEEGTAKVPGYSLITGYDYILFTPADSMETNGVADIRRGAESDELFYVGFLDTNKDLVEPALPAGTYLLAVRGQAAYPDRDAADAEEEPAEEGPKKDSEESLATKVRIDDFLQLDTSEDNFIFIDMTGKPVASIPVRKMDYGNPLAGATGMGAVDRTKTIQVPVEGKEGKTEPLEITEQWLDVRMFVKGKSRKGLKATLSVRFEDKLLDGDWRR